ncbi:MAG: hypothetical protein GY730_08405 [bacterium]|nr:hypothetical protein [bacterium]
MFNTLNLEEIFDDSIEYYVITNLNNDNMKKQNYYYVKVYPAHMDILNNKAESRSSIKIYIENSQVEIDGKALVGDSGFQVLYWMSTLSRDLQDNKAYLFEKAKARKEKELVQNESKKQYLQEALEEKAKNQIHIYQLTEEEIKKISGGNMQYGLVLTQPQQMNNKKIDVNTQFLSQSVIHCVNDSRLDDTTLLSIPNSTKKSVIQKNINGIKLRLSASSGKKSEAELMKEALLLGGSNLKNKDGQLKIGSNLYVDYNKGTISMKTKKFGNEKEVVGKLYEQYGNTIVHNKNLAGIVVDQKIVPPTLDVIVQPDNIINDKGEIKCGDLTYGKIVKKGSDVYIQDNEGQVLGRIVDKRYVVSKDNELMGVINKNNKIKAPSAKIFCNKNNKKGKDNVVTVNNIKVGTIITSGSGDSKLVNFLGEEVGSIKGNHVISNNRLLGIFDRNDNKIKEPLTNVVAREGNQVSDDNGIYLDDVYCGRIKNYENDNGTIVNTHNTAMALVNNDIITSLEENAQSKHILGVIDNGKIVNVDNTLNNIKRVQDDCVNIEAVISDIGDQENVHSILNDSLTKTDNMLELINNDRYFMKLDNSSTLDRVNDLHDAILEKIEKRGVSRRESLTADQYLTNIKSCSAKNLITDYYNDMVYIKKDLESQGVGKSEINRVVSSIKRLAEFASIIDGAVSIPSGKPEGYPAQPNPKRLIAKDNGSNKLLYNQISAEAKENLLSIYKKTGFSVNNAYFKKYLSKMKEMIDCTRRETVVDGNKIKESYSTRTVQFTNKLIFGIADGDSESIWAVQDFVTTIDDNSSARATYLDATVRTILLETAKNRSQATIECSLRIAKRDLTVTLLKKSGITSKRKAFINSFQDMLFNKKTLKILMDSPAISDSQKKKLNLLFSNIIILTNHSEAYKTDEIPEKMSVERKAEFKQKIQDDLKLAGIDTDLEMVKAWIDQGFINTAEVETTAEWLEKFAKSFKDNSLAASTLVAVLQNRPEVLAMKCIENHIQAHTGIASTDVISKNIDFDYNFGNYSKSNFSKEEAVFMQTKTIEDANKVHEYFNDGYIQDLELRRNEFKNTFDRMERELSADKKYKNDKGKNSSRIIRNLLSSSDEIHMVSILSKDTDSKNQEYLNENNKLIGPEFIKNIVTELIEGKKEVLHYGNELKEVKRLVACDDTGAILEVRGDNKNSISFYKGNTLVPNDKVFLGVADLKIDEKGNPSDELVGVFPNDKDTFKLLNPYLSELKGMLNVPGYKGCNWRKTHSNINKYNMSKCNTTTLGKLDLDNISYIDGAKRSRINNLARAGDKRHQLNEIDKRIDRVKNKRNFVSDSALEKEKISILEKRGIKKPVTRLVRQAILKVFLNSRLSIEEFTLKIKTHFEDDIIDEITKLNINDQELFRVIINRELDHFSGTLSVKSWIKDTKSDLPSSVIKEQNKFIRKNSAVGSIINTTKAKSQMSNRLKELKTGESFDINFGHIITVQPPKIARVAIESATGLDLSVDSSFRKGHVVEVAKIADPDNKSGHKYTVTIDYQRAVKCGVQFGLPEGIVSVRSDLGLELGGGINFQFESEEQVNSFTDDIVDGKVSMKSWSGATMAQARASIKAEVSFSVQVGFDDTLSGLESDLTMPGEYEDEDVESFEVGGSVGANIKKTVSGNFSHSEKTVEKTWEINGNLSVPPLSTLVKRGGEYLSKKKGSELDLNLAMEVKKSSVKESEFERGCLSGISHYKSAKINFGVLNNSLESMNKKNDDISFRLGLTAVLPFSLDELKESNPEIYKQIAELSIDKSASADSTFYVRYELDPEIIVRIAALNDPLSKDYNPKLAKKMSKDSNNLILTRLFAKSRNEISRRQKLNMDAVKIEKYAGGGLNNVDFSVDLRDVNPDLYRKKAKRK